MTPDVLYDQLNRDRFVSWMEEHVLRSVAA